MKKINFLDCIRMNFLYVLLIAAVVFLAAYYIKPQISTYLNNRSTLESKQSQLTDKKHELETEQEVIKKKKEEQERIKQKVEQQIVNRREKPMYKPDVYTDDAFSAVAPLFEDIVRLLKNNNIKLVSIENKTTGIEDAIAQGSITSVNSCQIDMKLLASYSQFRKFLEGIYKYPYLVNLSSITIKPYDKEKSLLVIDFSIVLYAEK